MSSAIAHPSVRQRLWGLAYLLLTMTALFWAGNSIVGRAARDAVPPVALAFWRWLLAFLLIIGFAWPHLKRDRPVLLANRWIILVLGTLGIGSFNMLLYSGLQYTTALNSLLMQSAQPALILLSGFLLFRERVGPLQLAGVLLSLAGVLTIVSQGHPTVLLNLRLNKGDAIILGAVVLWALYSVLLRRRPAVHPLSFLAVTFAVGITVILPFYLAELLSGRLIAPRPESFLAIAYVAIFPSLVAYAFFNRGVELIGSARTGLYLNVMPVFGSVLAIIFLGERFRLFHAIGIALIAAGIFLASRQGPQRT